MMNSITRGNNVLPAERMGNEELGAFVASESVAVLNRLDVLRPYFVELWKRFDELPEGGTINGCQTRSEFCERILHRSRRSVQYILYGRSRKQLPESFEPSCVQRLERPGGFEEKCQDPVLKGLVFAQARLLDTGDSLSAAVLEGMIVNHICDRLDSQQRERRYERDGY